MDFRERYLTININKCMKNLSKFAPRDQKFIKHISSNFNKVIEILLEGYNIIKGLSESLEKEVYLPEVV